MIRLSRLADYGIVIVTHLARRSDRQQNAAEIAAATRIPQPTVSKILKTLARADMLLSHRGARGGYGLARGAGEITVAEIIEVLDGPIAPHQLCRGRPARLRDREPLPGAEQLAADQRGDAHGSGRDHDRRDGAAHARRAGRPTTAVGRQRPGLKSGRQLS